MQYFLRSMIGIALVLLLPVISQATIVDRIVAVVNGEIITQVEFEEYLKLYGRFNAGDEQDLETAENDKLRRRVMDQMINELLVVQEADRFEMQVSDADVEAYIQRYKKDKQLSDSEFLEELQQQGIDPQEFKSQITRDIKKNRVINSMIRQKVVVTEDELREFYEKHKDRFKKPRQVHLRLLVVKDRKLLVRLRQAIVNDSLSFAQAARKHSTGPGAEQGGDMGVLNWKDLGSGWKEVLSGLEEKEVSEIFDLRGQYAILYPETITQGGTASFEQVKDSLRETVYSQKLNTRFQEYISGLRDKAVLDIKL
ncbi:MAG: SurA N-terminal domain-containing protein [Desulfohalobiaceae bacterium]|nr:SurA N-terminal domain-containing protein [Desulfohalobiaceae bacterium]